MADYYSVLGVQRTATRGEIRRAYKKLAKRWHPDKNLKNVDRATKRFAEISKAYSVLSDVRKRRHYDRRQLLNKLIEEIEKKLAAHINNIENMAHKNYKKT